MWELERLSKSAVGHMDDEEGTKWHAKMPVVSIVHHSEMPTEERGPFCTPLTPTES